MLCNVRIKAFWYAKDYSAINSEIIYNNIVNKNKLCS